MDVRVGLERKLSSEEWCFWTVVLEKTLETPLEGKKIQPVHPKGDQFWIFIGRTDAEAETPILWPPDANWLIGKDPDAGKDWRQKEKGMIEDEMVECHHWLNEHEFEQVPGFGDAQGSLSCCSSWGLKESDTTEPLNWTELKLFWTINMVRLCRARPSPIPSQTKSYSSSDLFLWIRRTPRYCLISI